MCSLCVLCCLCFVVWGVVFSLIFFASGWFAYFCFSFGAGGCFQFSLGALFFSLRGTGLVGEGKKQQTRPGLTTKRTPNTSHNNQSTPNMQHDHAARRPGILHEELSVGLLCKGNLKLVEWIPGLRVTPLFALFSSDS